MANSQNIYSLEDYRKKNAGEEFLSTQPAFDETMPRAAPTCIEGLAPSASAPVQVGSNLKHYEVLRELGCGGMGAVFLARDTKLGRLVAIKVLLEHGGQAARRFLAEARATARCKHDNIVVIHEVDEIQGYPYIVLEYLEGRTLRDWMLQRERSGVSGPEASTLLASRRCRRASRSRS